MIIGICGKSGSGKSTLANKLINIYGDKVIHIDIDKIGHQIYNNQNVLEELINFFGNSVIKNGIVDRKELGKIVFNSKSKMDKLSQITWKYMELEIDKIINDNKDKIIILDWLLLPKTKYFNEADIRILLDIPYYVRCNRAMMRDNITKEDFDLRDKASIIYDKTKFDLVLKDNGKDELRKLVKLL